jgi:hypothetical protein
MSIIHINKLPFNDAQKIEVNLKAAHDIYPDHQVVDIGGYVSVYFNETASGYQVFDIFDQKRGDRDTAVEHYRISSMPWKHGKLWWCGFHRSNNDKEIRMTGNSKYAAEVTAIAAAGMDAKDFAQTYLTEMSEG